MTRALYLSAAAASAAEQQPVRARDRQRAAAQSSTISNPTQLVDAWLSKGSAGSLRWCTTAAGGALQAVVM